MVKCPIEIKAIEWATAIHSTERSDSDFHTPSERGVVHMLSCMDSNLTVKVVFVLIATEYDML